MFFVYIVYNHHVIFMSTEELFEAYSNRTDCLSVHLAICLGRRPVHCEVIQYYSCVYSGKDSVKVRVGKNGTIYLK